MQYIPAHIMQMGWHTNLDNANCTMAAAAIALDRHTLGHIRATPPEMRANQDDQSEGTSLRDAAVAWKRYANQRLQTFDIGHPVSYEDFRGKIIAGHGAMLAGCYDQMYPGYACAHSFRGGHCIFVNQYLGGNYLVFDPLCGGPKWLPEQIVFRYGTKYASFTQSQANNSGGCPSVKVAANEWDSLWMMYAAFTDTEEKAHKKWDGKPYETSGPCHGPLPNCQDGYTPICTRGHLHCIKAAQVPRSRDDQPPTNDDIQQSTAVSGGIATTALIAALAIGGIAVVALMVLPMLRGRGVVPNAYV